MSSGIGKAMVLAAGLALVASSAGCRRTAGQAGAGKAETKTPLFERFAREVVPVLDRRCAGCHGVSAGEHRQIAAESANATLLRWVVEPDGRIRTAEQARLAYQACATPRQAEGRRFAPLDRRYPPVASPLLHAPLAEALGGGLYVHPEVFAALEDPDYQRLAGWVAAEIAARPEPPETLDSPPERFFAEKVMPVLQRKTCLGANCHGPLAFNDLLLVPSIPALPGGFTASMHKKNRREMLGRMTRFVHLAGDVLQSRQVAKNIPIEQGGVLHKGGNHFFNRGDPDFNVLKEWLLLEAAEERRRTGAPLGQMRGILFVRRPRATPERAFEDAAFQPGADLVWWRDGRETNLSAHLHPDGPADIRAPDVSYDGTRVVFSLRRAAGEPANLWELELASGRARQLTFSTDPAVNYLEPLYVPDPDDPEGARLDRVALVCVSNRAGGVCESSPGQAPRVAPRYDLYRLRWAAPGRERETFESTLRQMTFTGSQVRRPTLRSTAEVIFTTLRTGWQADRAFYNGALFRVFVDGSNFHTHYGNRSKIPILWDDRETPHGLELRIGRSADSWWGGTLVLSDHQFGPAVEPPEPGAAHHRKTPPHAQHKFFPGWIALDPRATWGGVSPGGAYRDPYPLPDGSLLVAHAAGPVDLDDPRAAPDFDIWRLVPDPAFQAPDGMGPGRYRRERLIGGPEASELWPRPVVVRSKERIPKEKTLKHAAWLFGPPPPSRQGGWTGYPAGTPALLQIFDLVLLETFFERNDPTGVRHLRAPVCPTCGDVTPEAQQVAGARVIAFVPLKKGEAGPPRRYLLAEGPLEADGSFQCQVPSGVAFDIQATNPWRMALSSPNRWLYALPGEKHTLSVPRALYAQTCGGCHGGLSGQPADVLHRPDVVTSASRTRAVWDEAARRRKRPPATPQALGREWVRETWERLAPLVARRCAGCHEGAEAAAGLDLAGPGAYEALLPHVDAKNGLAVRSYLMEKLAGRELAAPRRLEGDAPHPSGDRLTPEELLRFTRWIDLGAQRK